MRTVRILSAAAAITAAAASASLAQPAAPPAQLQLLDVPYIPQSEDLCGGAAAAMVMRYWGAAGVYAETFADLVDRQAGGIRGDDLLGAVRARGWDAQSFRGDAAAVRAHLDKRRPIVALIEDRPGRFHYVVVVGWRAGRVFLHDPARSPFRIVGEQAFETSWQSSGFWTLLVLPPPASRSVEADSSVASVRPDPRTAGGACAAMVDEGVRLAGAGGDRHAARELLEAAAAECPAAAAPWRELAGLSALGGAWPDAAAQAREALSRDRHDAHAWRLLATSLYLQRRDVAALAAWNEIGEPIVDLVRINGLERMRYDVAARMLDISPRALLTAQALRAADRNLSELPAAQFTRVTYRPAENGLAHVEATIVERPLLPASRLAIVATGVRLATDRELSVAVANPTGGGEVWTGSWRWWENRPRIGLAFAAPAPMGGVWRVEAFDDRQRYTDTTGTIDERRRGGFMAFSNWLARGTRLEVRAGGDRWRERGSAFVLDAQIMEPLAGDAVEVTARAATWLGSVRTWMAAFGAEWRSSTAPEGSVWMAGGGIEAAADSAPLALWAGAGTGQGRDALLRAHPLLDNGIIKDAVFGRRLTHATVEWRRWMRPARVPVRVAPAVFVDIARAFDGLPSFDTRAHVDVGGGIRVALPASGAVRIDVARGLRDGNTTLSVGWIR